MNSAKNQVTNLCGPGKESPALCVVRRPKMRGIGYHFGLLLPDGRIAHLLPNQGMAIVTLEEFACGDRVDILTRRQATWNATTVARLKVAQQENRRYDLLAWNCDTFANWVTTGKRTSHEVHAWLLIAALVAFLMTVKH